MAVYEGIKLPLTFKIIIGNENDNREGTLVNSPRRKIGILTASAYPLHSCRNYSMSQLYIVLKDPTSILQVIQPLLPTVTV